MDFEGGGDDVSDDSNEESGDLEAASPGRIEKRLMWGAKQYKFLKRRTFQKLHSSYREWYECILREMVDGRQYGDSDVCFMKKEVFSNQTIHAVLTQDRNEFSKIRLYEEGSEFPVETKLKLKPTIGNVTIFVIDGKGNRGVEKMKFYILHPKQLSLSFEMRKSTFVFSNVNNESVTRDSWKARPKDESQSSFIVLGVFNVLKR